MKQKAFLFKPSVKPKLKKVSVKLVLSEADSQDFETYCDLSKGSQSEVVSYFIRKVLRTDRKFKEFKRAQRTEPVATIKPQINKNPIVISKK